MFAGHAILHFPAPIDSPVILLYVAIGGAVGALARYIVAGMLHRLLGEAFPWGTMGVNLIGSFLLGVVITSIDTTPVAARIQALLAIGFLGDFTTFSTFSHEGISMLRERSYPLAVVYVGTSVVLCVVGVLAGVTMGNAIRG